MGRYYSDNGGIWSAIGHALAVLIVLAILFCAVVGVAQFVPGGPEWIQPAIDWITAVFGTTTATVPEPTAIIG